MKDHHTIFEANPAFKTNSAFKAKTADPRRFGTRQSRGATAPNETRVAFTLIEVVTCLTVGSVLVLLAVSLLNRSLKIHQAAEHRAAVTRQLDRIVPQFRRLVHASSTAQVSDGGAKLTLREGEEEFVFRFDGEYLYWPESRTKDASKLLGSISTLPSKTPRSDDATAGVGFELDQRAEVTSIIASSRVRLQDNSIMGTRSCHFSIVGDEVVLQVVLTPIPSGSESGLVTEASNSESALLERHAVATLAKWQTIDNANPESDEAPANGRDDS